MGRNEDYRTERDVWARVLHPDEDMAYCLLHNTDYHIVNGCSRCKAEERRLVLMAHSEARSASRGFAWCVATAAFAVILSLCWLLYRYLFCLLTLCGGN